MRLLRFLLSGTLTLTPSRHRFFSSSAPIPVRRVTKSNFDSALEDLRRHVRDADFVALDLEMSGVTSAPWRDSFQYDSLDVRYLKVKDSAEKFAVLQFGVCPFRWDPSKDSFIAHPLSFYIFPRKELPVAVPGPTYEFLCQTTSIDFLAKYQFDFNAWIHEGVSYLSRAQETEALHLLRLGYDSEFGNLKDVSEIPSVSTFDVLFSERMKIRLREWCHGLLRNPSQADHFLKNSDGSSPQLQTIFFKLRPALMLNGFTSHQLRLIQLIVTKHFKDLTYVRVKCGNSSEEKFVVYTDSEDDKVLLMKEVKEDLHMQMEANIKAAVGFRHVIDLLASEQKLVIGHNCFLDMAHIYNKFCGPLPSSIGEFTSSIQKIFPYIVDTKHLLKSDLIMQNLMKNKSTSLSAAFALLCPQIAFTSDNTSLASRPCVKVEVQPDAMSPSCWNSGAKHEAGYDAFMTGCVFAQACSHLGVDFELVHSQHTEVAKDERLQKHINLLYLSWNSGAIIDLRTGSEIPEIRFQNPKQRYPKIIFANIVLIWGFPSKFKPREIRECISKVFGLCSVTAIYYLDETAAFVQFSKKEFVSDFLALKDALETRNDPISVLHPLAKLLEGGKTRAANYEVYKQICSSPISRYFFADQAQAVGITWKSETESEVETDYQELVSFRETPSQEANSDSPANSTTVQKHDVIGDVNCRLSHAQILDSLRVGEVLKGGRKPQKTW